MHPDAAAAVANEIGVIALHDQVVNIVAFRPSFPSQLPDNQRRPRPRDNGVSNAQRGGGDKALAVHIERMLARRLDGFHRLPRRGVAQRNGKQKVGMAVADRNDAPRFRLSGRRVARDDRLSRLRRLYRAGGKIGCYQRVTWLLFRQKMFRYRQTSIWVFWHKFYLSPIFHKDIQFS